MKCPYCGSDDIQIDVGVTAVYRVVGVDDLPGENRVKIDNGKYAVVGDVICRIDPSNSDDGEFPTEGIFCNKCCRGF